MKNFLKSNWAILGVTALAVFFRFWQIGSLPAGLFPDEAAYGMDGRSIVNGDFQPFFERGNGREGLFMYFLAIAIKLFGYHPWANHLVSASFGLATVIATYFLAKEFFDKRTGVLSSFLLACSAYAVTMTRTAFRANTVPLLSTLTILFLVRAINSTDPKKKIYNSILSGLFFGLGFYTYISYRMILPLMVGFAVLLIIGYRGKLFELWREYRKPILAFFAAFIIAFSWIGYYFFVTHPGSFVGRAGQVSIFSESLNNGDVVGTFLNVFKATALSYFTQGDLNWRHNISGQPFLSPLVSPFFLVTVLAYAWAFLIFLKQTLTKTITGPALKKGFLVAWFALMLVPEISTAEGIPHGLRLIGTIPVIFVLSARGLIWIWDKLNEALPHKFMHKISLTVFVISLVYSNYFLYFNIAAKSPDYYYAFRSDLTVVSDYLNGRNNKNQTYLSLDAFSVQTVDYLTTPTSQPYILLVPEKSFETTMQSKEQMVFTQSTLPDAKKYSETHPDAKLVMTAENQFDQIIMLVYEKP